MAITEQPTSWSSIPNKIELAIICSVRVVDFFQQAALQAVMFYQLSSFAPETAESDISIQVGVLQGAFTAAQIFTSLLWGKVADHPSWGRKRVILTSLIGQGISCSGVAFSRSFTAAVVWRLLGGALNASVGGARTALSEKTDKKYHSRTFLLLPLAWNIAQIVAPSVGGLLSDPVKYYPQWFGENSTLGHRTGVAWLRTFPYAGPSLFSALILFADAFVVWIGLTETLGARLEKRDRGRELAARIVSFFCKSNRVRTEYVQVNQDEEEPGCIPDHLELEMTPSSPAEPEDREIAETCLPKPHRRGTHPPLRVLNNDVLRALTIVAFLDFTFGGFTALWTMFLASERHDDQHDPRTRLPFRFTGGLGFPPSTIGLAMSILGIIGITCQLILYPRVSARLGLVRSTKYALFLFPIAYTLAPFLSLIRNVYPLWAGITGVAMIHITGRTFATPGAVLLVNNSSPSPSVLGTIHGYGASVQAASRTLGPVFVGWWYSDGAQRGMVGEAWWLLAACALLGCIPIYWVREEQ